MQRLLISINPSLKRPQSTCRGYTFTSFKVSGLVHQRSKDIKWSRMKRTSRETEGGTDGAHNNSLEKARRYTKQRYVQSKHIFRTCVRRSYQNQDIETTPKIFNSHRILSKIRLEIRKIWKRLARIIYYGYRAFRQWGLLESRWIAWTGSTKERLKGTVTVFEMSKQIIRIKQIR